MKCYFVKNCEEKYYYDKNMGICTKKNGAVKVLLANGCDNFGFWKNDRVHIICADAENRIIYLIYDGKTTTTHILYDKTEGAVPDNFNITYYNNCLFIIYRVFYNNWYYVFYYAPKTMNAPASLGKLNHDNPDFYPFHDKVYYVDDSGCLIKKYLDRNREGRIISKSGKMPYCAEIGGEEYLAYVRDDALYINDSQIISDKACKYPVIFGEGDRQYVQWMSGSYVLYLIIPSDNSYPPNPTKYIINSDSVGLLDVFSDNQFYKCYGVNHKPFVEL